jgi:uncharacterized protein with HEPN domain
LRRDELYLRDMIEAADAIAGFIADTDESVFAGNDLLRSATLLKLTIIGEASARLSDELKTRHPDVEWRDIVGFRNIAVHAYFSANWSIVWVAATTDAPALRTRILQILEAEFPLSPVNAWMSSEGDEPVN